MSRLILYISILIFASGCNSDKAGQGKMLARVYDNYLFELDIEGLVLENTSKRDSTVLVQNFINNWIKTQLMINQAERNVVVQKLNLDQQLKEYRNSLIIYNYETELIRQKLDTVVSEREIESYYIEHQSDFELKENIARMTYVIFSNTLKDRDKTKIRSLYKQPDSVIIESLEKKIGAITQSYHVDTVNWVSFTDLQSVIPIETYNQELFLRGHRLVELSDDNYTYILKFINYKIKDDISPLDFKRNDIRDIIINKRKMMLIQKVRNDIFNQALKNNDFEIFVKN